MPNLLTRSAWLLVLWVLSGGVVWATPAEVLPDALQESSPEVPPEVPQELPQDTSRDAPGPAPEAETGPPLVADAPMPETGPPPAADAPAPEIVRTRCNEPGSAENAWIDKLQRGLYGSVCGTALWFDGLFGNPRYDNDSDDTFGRLGLFENYDDRDGFDTKIRLRARYAKFRAFGHYCEKPVEQTG